MDNDGDLDLLVGEKYENVHYYQRQSDGSLHEMPVLIKLEKPDNNPNLSYMSISPAVADVNGDGKSDIILGADVYKSGRPFPLRLYINKGTKENPLFNDYDTLRDSKNSIIQMNCGRVVIADLDADGRKDLIVGDKKVNVLFYKNIGSNSSPVYEKHVLIPSDEFGIEEKPDFQQTGGFGYAFPKVFDWNMDGKPDLFLSGYTAGKVLVYINDGTTGMYKNSTEYLPKNSFCIKNGKLFLNLNLSGLCSVKIFDTAGRMIYFSESYEIGGIDISFLKPGNYILAVKNVNSLNAFEFIKKQRH